MQGYGGELKRVDGKRHSWCRVCGRPIILVEVAGTGEVAVHAELTPEEQTIRKNRTCGDIPGDFGDAEGCAALWGER